jgi:hypothetical protein
MKRRDVFIQILHEVSGKPKSFIEGLLDSFITATGVSNRFDEDITEVEYKTLLEGMRKEKEGIKAWLIQGNLDFVLRHGDPFGKA